MKQLLKNTKFWIKISHGKVYQKFRFPTFYKNYKQELEFYKSLFKTKPKLIFDVGANIGFKTQMFLEIAEKVVSFEPAPKMLKILNARFGNSKRVLIIEKALSSLVEENVIFYDLDGYEAMSSLSIKHIETVVKNRTNSVNKNLNNLLISTSTLDNYINKFGIPCYIKIDVEGFELEVVKGLTFTPSLISIEANLPDFLDETLLILERLSNISSDNYSYNISTDNKFLFEKFQKKDEIIFFLKHTPLKYLEIFAKLL